MRVYGTVWYFAFTIALGFMLGEHTEVSPIPVPWLLLRCSLLIVGIVLLWLLIRHPDTVRSTRWLRRCAGAIGIGTVSVLYGFVAGSARATHVEHWLGQPVTIEATVVSTAKKHRTSVWLEITSLRAAGTMTGEMAAGWKFSHQTGDTDGRYMTVPCHVKALWWTPKLATTAGRLAPGSRYLIRGVIVRLTTYTLRNSDADSSNYAYGFRGAPIRRIESVDVWQRYRDWIHQTANRIAPNHVSEVNLVFSMVFGGGTPDTAVRDAFLSAGLLHVLVASGANVLLLETAMERGLYPIWRLLRLPRGMWSLLVCGAIWGFAGLSGFDASIERAAWMANYRLLGQFLGRKPTMEGGMAYSALLMAITDPGQLLSLSACMSFLATLAIGKATRRRTTGQQHRRDRESNTVIVTCLRHAVLGVKVSLWIEATLLPVTLFEFGQMTPFSVLSNLLVEPLLFLLLPCAAVWLTVVMVQAAVPCLAPVCSAVQVICFAGVDLLLRVVKWIASFPFSLMTLPKPPLVLIVFYYLLLFGVPTIWRHRDQLTSKLSNNFSKIASAPIVEEDVL